MFRFHILSLSVLLATAFISPVFAGTESNRPKYQPRPYKIDVSSTFIQETRLRAAHYRQTADISQPAWFDGTPSANVSEIAHYLASDYDWYEYQNAINANFSHYMTTIPSPGSFYPHDLNIHFIHQKSQRKDAIPLILLHGWPSTCLEWEKVIKKLADPQDPLKPAFHVVAPDLPGFGFSPAAPAPGLGRSGHATIFDSLMQQLGYHSYAVYSTDMGVAAGLAMVDQYEKRILHHMTDFYWVLPNATDLQRYAQNQTTAEESQYIDAVNAYLDVHGGYALVHSTYPLAIAHALNDSPIGFLAWMWHLDFTGRDLSIPYTMKELVSQAMTLFIPGVYGNIRGYKELTPVVLPGRKPSRMPTSVTQWGYPKPSYEDWRNFNYVVSSIYDTPASKMLLTHRSQKIG